MSLAILNRLVASEKLGSALLVPVWGATIAAIYAHAMFQGSYPTLLDYSLVLAVCVMGGALMMDMGRALLGFFAAILIGLAILFFIATLPASLGQVPPLGQFAVYGIWSGIIFTSIFPIPIISFLVASALGSIVGERIF
jgi:hypothetical protein